MLKSMAKIAERDAIVHAVESSELIQDVENRFDGLRPRARRG